MKMKPLGTRKRAALVGALVLVAIASMVAIAYAAPAIPADATAPANHYGTDCAGCHAITVVTPPTGGDTGGTTGGSTGSTPTVDADDCDDASETVCADDALEAADDCTDDAADAIEADDDADDAADAIEADDDANEAAEADEVDDDHAAGTAPAAPAASVGDSGHDRSSAGSGAPSTGITHDGDSDGGDASGSDD